MRQLKEYERKHQAVRRQSLSKSKEGPTATASTTPRYRTPETRTPNHSAKSSQVLQQAGYGSPRKVLVESNHNYPGRDMVDPEIDRRIAELRKKYALPERTRGNVSSFGLIKHVRTPLASPEKGPEPSLLSSTGGSKGLKDVFCRLKTSERENSRDDSFVYRQHLFGESPDKARLQKAPNKLLAKHRYETRHLDGGVGLPFRKQATGEHALRKG